MKSAQQERKRVLGKAFKSYKYSFKGVWVGGVESGHLFKKSEK